MKPKRVILCDIQTPGKTVNKTMAGGMGTSSDYGSSLIAQALTGSKRLFAKVPIPELGILEQILRDNGLAAEQYRGNVDSLPMTGDLYILWGSIGCYEEEVLALQRVRSENSRARTGVIGTFASVRPEEYLPYSDFVVAGDPENCFMEGIPDELSGLVHNRSIADLDELPYPKWSGLNKNDFQHRFFFGGRKVVPVLSARGCPFSCGYYCPYPITGGKKVRARSAQSLAAEIRFHQQTGGAQAILLREPTFTINRQRVEQFCQEILRQAPGILWHCETHVNCLDPGLIDLMYAAGARAITIGVETRSDTVLNSMHRPDSGDDRIKEIVDYCEKTGIRVMAGYVLAMPDDTKESTLATLKYAAYLNSTYAQFTVCTPYPGTDFYEDLKDDIVAENWNQYTGYDLIYKHKHFTPVEVEKLKSFAYRSYYLRAKWMATRLRYTFGLL